MFSKEKVYSASHERGNLACHDREILGWRQFEESLRERPVEGLGSVNRAKIWQTEVGYRVRAELDEELHQTIRFIEKDLSVAQVHQPAAVSRKTLFCH